MPRPSRAASAIRPGVFAELQRRIDAHAARGGDLVPLQIGDTCVEPPASARFDAAADDSLRRYGATAGETWLRSAIATFTRDVRGFVDVDESRHVLIGCGGTHALSCAARVLLDPGDEVLLAAPYWPLAPGIIASCGARAIEVPLTDRLYADPSFDVAAAFEAKVTERTRAIYLITPNNPDGKVLSASDLAAIARVAEAHDLWVIADEVYADHVFGDLAHASIANLPGMRARTITATSLSKSHALAGARIGWIIAPEEIVVAARRVSTHTVFNVPVATQSIALAALADASAFVARARTHYRAARDIAAAAMEGSRARFSIPDGGTYLFIDFAEVLAGRPLRVLLEAAIDRGVLLAPGEAFGEAYGTWARLCYSAVPEPRLREGIARLRDAIDSLR